MVCFQLMSKFGCPFKGQYTCAYIVVFEVFLKVGSHNPTFTVLESTITQTQRSLDPKNGGTDTERIY